MIRRLSHGRRGEGGGEREREGHVGRGGREAEGVREEKKVRGGEDVSAEVRKEEAVTKNPKP